MTILQEALDLVDGERQEDYGPPSKMADRVSELFFGMTGVDLSPRQCIQFMMAMKLARLVETPDHRDSWVDLAGYIEVLDRVEGSPMIDGSKFVHARLVSDADRDPTYS